MKEINLTPTHNKNKFILNLLSFSCCKLQTSLCFTATEKNCEFNLIFDHFVIMQFCKLEYNIFNKTVGKKNKKIQSLSSHGILFCALLQNEKFGITF